MTTPHHEHDSDCDIYVGSRKLPHPTVDEPDVWHDFYICPNKESINLIYRWGPMGDYGSNYRFFHMSEKMQLCYDLAMASDAVSEDQKFLLNRCINWVLVEEMRNMADCMHSVPVKENLRIYQEMRRLRFPGSV